MGGRVGLAVVRGCAQLQGQLATGPVAVRPALGAATSRRVGIRRALVHGVLLEAARPRTDHGHKHHQAAAAAQFPLGPALALCQLQVEGEAARGPTHRLAEAALVLTALAVLVPMVVAALVPMAVAAHRGAQPAVQWVGQPVAHPEACLAAQQGRPAEAGPKSVGRLGRGHDRPRHHRHWEAVTAVGKVRRDPGIGLDLVRQTDPSHWLPAIRRLARAAHRKSADRFQICGSGSQWPQYPYSRYTNRQSAG